MTMIQLMIKKPKPVECIKYDGFNYAEIRVWAGTLVFEDATGVAVKTPNGALPVNIGDYIFKGGESDFYPVTDKFVKENYDEVITAM